MEETADKKKRIGRMQMRAKDGKETPLYGARMWKCRYRKKANDKKEAELLNDDMTLFAHV